VLPGFDPGFPFLWVLPFAYEGQGPLLSGTGGCGVLIRRNNPFAWALFLFVANIGRRYRLVFLFFLFGRQLYPSTTFKPWSRFAFALINSCSGCFSTTGSAFASSLQKISGSGSAFFFSFSFTRSICRVP